MNGWKNLGHIDEPQREQIMRRIVRGEAPSYFNEQGERMVWAGSDLEPFWALDLVAKVRNEVANLRRGFNQASGKHRRSSVRLGRRRRAA